MEVMEKRKKSLSIPPVKKSKELKFMVSKLHERVRIYAKSCFVLRV